jgi:hypothetical protein
MVFELSCELRSGPLALAGCSTSIDVTGGVVVGVAVGVGTIEGDGVVDGVAVGTLLADGLGLVVAGDVQPLIDTRAREPIKSNGNAYLSGVLMYRFIILAIGFILHPPISKNKFHPPISKNKYVR